MSEEQPIITSGKPLDQKFHHLLSIVVRAYRLCLDVERVLLDKLQRTDILIVRDRMRLEMDLMHLRIMGYLLHYAPSEQAIATLARDIVSCDPREDIIALGEFYDNYFLRSCESEFLCN